MRLDALLQSLHGRTVQEKGTALERLWRVSVAGAPNWSSWIHSQRPWYPESQYTLGVFGNKSGCLVNQHWQNPQ
jgi:hypothetical protein